jgi:hypothetical protein
MGIVNVVLPASLLPSSSDFYFSGTIRLFDLVLITFVTLLINKLPQMVFPPFISTIEISAAGMFHKAQLTRPGKWQKM